MRHVGGARVGGAGEERCRIDVDRIEDVDTAMRSGTSDLVHAKSNQCVDSLLLLSSRRLPSRLRPLRPVALLACAELA